MTGKIIMLFTLSALLLTLPLGAYSHSDEVESDENAELGNSFLTYLSYTWTSVSIGLFAIGILLIASLFLKNNLDNSHKKALYFSTAAVISIVTLYLIISTLSINIMSETKGPVHWHADFEIWYCGEKIDLVDPGGISSKVGTNILHEHNDDRIHVEGVVMERHHADLYNFFRTIGGYLEYGSLGVPAIDGFVEIRDGDLCSGRQGKIQVFVYKVLNPQSAGVWEFEQLKLLDFRNYVLSPFSNVPPGDCIIIEFDQEKDFTDRMCNTYIQSMQKGDMIGS
ncbi:hypothetical protein HYU10_04450 [Candidatus Woesearchaeota archaeon]|nr:hypothetical protein [Candidatus Woesearchaeota archaeon]